MGKIFKKWKFLCNWPTVYSSIPATLRELENDDEVEKQKVGNIKKKLDEYLRTKPDASKTHLIIDLTSPHQNHLIIGKID